MFVQSTYAEQNPATTISVTFPFQQSAGNLNILAIYWFTGVEDIANITDTAGNTYNLQIHAFNSNNNTSLFYCNGIIGQPPGNVITVTLTGSSGFVSVIAAEYAGVTGGIDASVSSQGTNVAGPAICGPVATKQSSDLLVAFVAVSANRYISTGAPWTERVVTSSFKMALVDQTAGAPGGYSISSTISATPSFWEVLLVSFLFVAPLEIKVLPASNITSSSATLNAAITNVGSGGAATTAGFNWGLTTAYGSVVSAPGTYGLGPFSQALTGLQPFTVYHYQAFTVNSIGVSISADQSFYTALISAQGEAVLAGPVIGSPGSYQNNGNTIANLFDANEMTWWDALHAYGDWAGIDAGTDTAITRVRISPKGAFEDKLLGGKIQGSDDPNFLLGVTTILTFTTRPGTGMLLNEYALDPGPFVYRYYRYLSAPNANGSIADIEFLGLYIGGVIANCDRVTFSPNGGVYDYPVVIRLSTITQGCSIYYTLDGSLPTITSIPYTGPFTVPSNCTVTAVACSLGLGNSRPVSQIYTVGGQIISTQIKQDNNRGYRIWAINTNFMFDPVSQKWFMYGNNMDQVSIYWSQIGINCYSSNDFRNWKYESIVVTPPPGAAKGSNGQHDRFHCVYNARNNNYVAWTRATSGSGYGPIACYTSPTPTGPFTNVNTPINLRGIPTGGDIKVWQEPDYSAAYLIWDKTGNGIINIDKLNASYTDIDGVNFYTHNNDATGPFGWTGEGFAFAKVGSTYFWMASQAGTWLPNINTYVTSNSPFGPWSVKQNPFANVVIPQTAEEAVVPLTANYLNSYDTQCVHLINIPGRNALIWVGDRYDILHPFSVQSLTDSFIRYRTIMMPAIITGGTNMSITWDPAWKLDSYFPTVTGAPLPASGLNIVGNTATWVNNEPRPYNLYLDASPDVTFKTVASEVLDPASTSFTITAQTGPFYRIRTVNVNGTALSNVFPLSVATLPATPGLSTATLFGNVTSLGSSDVTEQGFNWGLTNSYGNVVTTDGIFETGPFSDDITGLATTTTYHYQAFATNQSGTALGSDMTFTTVVAAPTVTTVAATPIASTSATLNGFLTNTGGEPVTSEGFYYGPDENLGTVIEIDGSFSVPGAFSNKLTGLSPSTPYFFQAFATNTVATVTGDIVSFTTSKAQIVSRVSIFPTIPTPLAQSGPLTGISSLPYTGWGGSLQLPPAGPPFSLASEDPCQSGGLDTLTSNFVAAFKMALSISGQTMEFAFSDGVTATGRIYAKICVLWITDESAYPIRHSHQYNTVLFQNEQKLQMLASSVPERARLYANDYLDISDPCSLIMTSYKIMTSILKTGIITLTLNVMGSTPQTTSGIT